MRTSRVITWARLRVYFGALLLALFALGALCIYVSFHADRQSAHVRSDLLMLGGALIALAVGSGVFAGVLKRRLSEDE
jgi:uncharacterized membrane protein YphA (DoxX/SURF4 family)